MARGSGKTELVKAAALWAILNGYRKFVVIVGATAQDAARIMADLKSTLACNDRIHAAFPEATHAIRDMRGTPQKARAQTWADGTPTGLEWTRTGVRLAWVKGAPCSGACLATAGLTGAIRGLSATGPDGETLRPDLALADDVQDRESATSPAQTAERLRIIRGDVLGLAGPTKTIAALATLTVIAEGDLADQLLDRERNPQWQGERMRMAESFPADEALWATYFDIRANELRSGGTGRAATEFYRARRPAMDIGCVMNWPERFDAGRYASAVEEMMVKRHDDPEAFAAEMQNDPVRSEAARSSARELSTAAVAGKLNNVPRGVVPAGCTRVVGMIDVGSSVLWYGVAAFDERFNGAVVDYGCYPPQNRTYFAARDARPALADVFPGMDESQMVFAGLRVLTDDLLGRRYARQDTGEPAAVERCLVDARWQTDVVHQLCRQSAHAAALLAATGYSTASSVRAMNDWQTKPGERVGWNWRLGPASGGRGRQLLFDPDHWKSFAADRLATPPGSSGCLQLFGGTADAHRMLADHVCAEYAVRVAVRDRVFDRWELRPNRDNHLLDVLVGLCVAASVQGLVWSASGEPAPPRPPRKKINLSDLFYAKHGYRAGDPMPNRV
jgi:hypothetical protein